MATLKKETIQITLEKGSGTILVTRPDNTGKTIGLIHQFTYTGDATMDMMQALTAARRQLTAQMAAAAAKPAPPATKPAATGAKPSAGAEPTDEDDQGDANDEATEGDEATAEQTDGDATSAEPDDEPTDPASAPHFDELSTPHFDELSAPPELEPITTDDQAGDDLTDVGDIQALLLF